MFSRIYANIIQQTRNFTWFSGNQPSQMNCVNDVCVFKKELEPEKHLPTWIENCAEISQSEISRLSAEFPLIVEEIRNFPTIAKLPLFKQRFEKLMTYIKQYSPVLAVQVIIMGKFYAKTKNDGHGDTEEEQTKLLYKLAWIIEVVVREAFLLDDLTDGSESRHNHTCWHEIDGTNLKTIAEGKAMFNGGLLLLKQYFKNKHYYSDLLDVINEAYFITAAAEVEIAWLNVHTVAERNCSLEFVEGKKLVNASLLVNLPIRAAMIMNNVCDPEIVKEVTEVGLDVWHYGSLVDDYADCFGDDRVNQRKSNDIQEGKITYALLKAMELGSLKQRDILKEFYGKSDDKSVQMVKNIYNDLRIKQILQDEASDLARNLEAKISQLDPDKYPCNFWLQMINQFRGALHGKCARIF